jgi:hypothetical protein
MRSKLLPLTLLLLVSVPSLLLAQTDRSNLQFYLSARFAGQATVTFGNVGSISSNSEIGDTSTVMNRLYADGAVLLDGRYTDDGDKIPPDGRTSRWVFNSSSQVLEDGSGIAFNDYSTDGNGSSVSADAPGSPGVDLEFALRLADYGTGGFGMAGPVNWGISFGFGLNDLNVKYEETIQATLNATRDAYSLFGATAPDGPYRSPSSESITITNPDGTTSSFLVDTSILLQDLPYDRTSTITPGGADVNGYWEIDGSSLTFRLGPWFRWRPIDRLSFRASVGVSATVMGVTFGYNEQALVADDRTISAIAESETERYDYIGFYGTLDAEFWFTPVTGVFAGVTYQSTSTDMRLALDGRTADIELATSVGFRIGITTHF